MDESLKVTSTTLKNFDIYIIYIYNDICIIYQKKDSKRLASTENGIPKLIEAARTEMMKCGID